MQFWEYIYMFAQLIRVFRLKHSCECFHMSAAVERWLKNMKWYMSV